MITLSKRAHLFGGKSDEVRGKKFWRLVSTAKEGIFKRESTVIFRMDAPASRMGDYTPLVKVLYPGPASKQDRLDAHDEIVQFINGRADAEEAPDLDTVLFELDGSLLATGKIAEFLYFDL